MVSRRPARSRRPPGRQAGVYGQVLAALQEQLVICQTNGVPSAPVIGETVTAMEAARPVVVPQSVLPKSARPPLVAGRPVGMVRLLPDAEVRLLGEPCGRAILLWLGIWGDGDELLIAKHGPDALARLHGECCGL